VLVYNTVQIMLLRYSLLRHCCFGSKPCWFFLSHSIWEWTGREGGGTNYGNWWLNKTSKTLSNSSKQWAGVGNIIWKNNEERNF